MKLIERVKAQNVELARLRDELEAATKGSLTKAELNELGDELELAERRAESAKHMARTLARR